MKVNTELCIDLKTFLQIDSVLREGKAYRGELILDSEMHATFVEKARRRSVKRNIRIFDGNFITMTYRLMDGYIRLNFKKIVINSTFNADYYAIGVYKEIREALKGFIEGKAAE